MKFSAILILLQIAASAACLNGSAASAASYGEAVKHRGKTYHVSVGGSDAADGSLARPFKTIQAAANAAMPGDVVTVHAGVYREQITPPRGGNSNEDRIVYEAAKGEKVEVKGSEVIKGWKKLNNDTWEVKIPNTFFGKFNPYSDRIHGDWFWPTPKDRKYHTGCVYLNGDWLMEAARQEEVMNTTDAKNLLWFANVDSTTTTIWAQFKNVNPNDQTVEINVRQKVFYPDKPFTNFITLRGFTMEQAATNWAPPTAEQMGIVGTNWSRGWIIENNTIQYSKCVGISLGKHGDQYDNTSEDAAEGYVATINRALAFGWNKSTIGGHIVRNNHVAYCEQTGIVGSMGCSFSVVEGNVIHDTYVHRLFDGAEMAGIKFHGAIDVQIKGNHIYRTNMGIWLDWMAQGAQVKNNLMHDNLLDLFFEVNHGPILVSNNILFSNASLTMNSSGAAFVHNIFGGAIDVVMYDGRLTPYHRPHSTYVAALHDNPGGDVRFINNLFVKESTPRSYDKAILSVVLSGNVYTKGTNKPVADDYVNKYGVLSDTLKAKLQDKQENEALNKQHFDAGAKLVTEKDGVYLEISLDKGWLTEQKRALVTTGLLGKVTIPNLPFENVDGSSLIIDTDYFGKKRNLSNPSPGPFEIMNSGKKRIKVW